MTALESRYAETSNLKSSPNKSEDFLGTWLSEHFYVLA